MNLWNFYVQFFAPSARLLLYNMSDSGEDWDLEISSGVSKPVKTRTTTQNNGFSGSERRLGRGRARYTGYECANGSHHPEERANPWNTRKDFNSGNTRQRYTSNGSVGTTNDSDGVLRITVSSRDVGKIIGRSSDFDIPALQKGDYSM